MEFFSVESSTTKPYELEDLVPFMIRYQMSSDLITYQRVVYSFLDLLGDIGGLNEAIIAICSLFLFFLQRDPVSSVLVSKLYSHRVD